MLIRLIKATQAKLDESTIFPITIATNLTASFRTKSVSQFSKPLYTCHNGGLRQKCYCIKKYLNIQ